MQDMFPKDLQEVRFSFTHMSIDDEVTERARRADVCAGETVIEYQHSRITLEEVRARNSDYERFGKRVIWVVDCTQNVNMPVRISSPDDEEEVWMLEFDRKWQVHSVSECAIVFADFGDRIFRVPVASTRHRMVAAFGSICTGAEFASHLVSPTLEVEVAVPTQSRLTVAQDPHGSGKTYRLTRMMIHADADVDHRYRLYRTFIVVTKPHSAKDVVYAEFMKHLRDSQCEIREVREDRQYVVKFTRPGGADVIMAIFGTADSLMWGLADNKVRGTDAFINLVRTIHEHGPTKLVGPKGRMRNYGCEQPQINPKTLLITDEATMLPEAYAGAFATLMHTCNVDVHLAGDVQQSTSFEKNLMTRVVREYNEATSLQRSRLPSFPCSEVIIKPGNQVRRFNQDLVDFRNTVMAGFHSHPTHNLGIAVPVAAGDVQHDRGEFSVHSIAYTGCGADQDDIEDAVSDIMGRIRRDVDESALLPNDLLVVTPFVSNNPLMDQLRTLIEEFWAQRFADSTYVDRVRDKPDFAATNRLARAAAEDGEGLPWLCVLHRSEENKPIDTKESRYGTRIVSIHASQGDGRRFVYLVGVTERALTRFTCGERNLKYESLLNVAVSRMKEVVRVYLERTYDDVWERFLPVMPPEMRHAVPPTVSARVGFELSGCEMDDGAQGLFEASKLRFASIGQLEATGDLCERASPLDYAHHVVRMQSAHCIFHARVLAHQAENGDRFSEQLHTIFAKLERSPIDACDSKDYYRKLRLEPRCVIPLLYYDTGASRYMAVHKRIHALLREVQSDVRGWLRGGQVDLRAFSPEKAVVMQYAVGYISSGAWGGVKMDTVYDVVNCYTSTEDNAKLQRHYDELKGVNRLFDQVIEWGNCEAWSWKIARRIKLGTADGGALPCFEVRGAIDHLLLTDTHAAPVVLVPDVDEMSMASRCAQALSQTLVCMRCEEERHENGRGNPTWKLVKGKQITICFVPIKARRPIFVDVSQVVRGNIAEIAAWVSRYIRRETEADHPRVLKMAEHHRHDFDAAVDEIAAACRRKRCPDYIHRAFVLASNKAGFCDLSQELRCALNKDIGRFSGKLCANAEPGDRPTT